MKWMEFIKIQTDNSDVVVNELNFIELCKEFHGLLEAKVCHNATTGDCLICLSWSTMKPEQQGSSVGLILSNSMRRYGLVDHSVWIENKK